MAENTNLQATNSPVQVTQDAPMPGADQQTPQQGQVDTGAASTVSEVSPQQVSSEGLPENTSERTKEQFEKLREQLRTEREQRVRLQSLFQTPQTPVQPTQQPSPLYDPITGELNEQVFTDVQRRAFEAEERAKRAELTIQQFQQNQIASEDERQRQEAIAKYPELDSNSKNFDTTLHRQVRQILTDSMLYPQEYGNKSISYLEAADLARGVSQRVINQAKSQGAQEALEQLTPKEQASLEAVGSPDRRQEVETPLPSLRERSRKGDLDAIVERLKGIPVVGRG